MTTRETKSVKGVYLKNDSMALGEIPSGFASFYVSVRKVRSSEMGGMVNDVVTVSGFPSVHWTRDRGLTVFFLRHNS